MNNRTLSMVSYFTLIGWLIAYFMGKEKADDLLKYHLRQSLGLAIVSILFNVLTNIIAYIIPGLAFVGMLGLVIVILWVMGMINAANGAKRPVPLVGKMFENKFAFVS
jgi:uncharacterized membrane protein